MGSIGGYQVSGKGCSMVAVGQAHEAEARKREVGLVGETEEAYAEGLFAA